MALKIKKDKPLVIDGSLVSGFTAPWASYEANIQPYSHSQVNKRFVTGVTGVSLAGHGSTVRKLYTVKSHLHVLM